MGTEEFDKGLKVVVVLDDQSLAIEAPSGRLGLWALEQIDIERLSGDKFLLRLNGESVTFSADDPLDFAYSALPVVEKANADDGRRSWFKKQKAMKPAETDVKPSKPAPPKKASKSARTPPPEQERRPLSEMVAAAKPAKPKPRSFELASAPPDVKPRPRPGKLVDVPAKTDAQRTAAAASEPADRVKTPTPDRSDARRAVAKAVQAIGDVPAKARPTADRQAVKAGRAGVTKEPAKEIAREVAKEVAKQPAARETAAPAKPQVQQPAARTGRPAVDEAVRQPPTVTRPAAETSNHDERRPRVTREAFPRLKTVPVPDPSRTVETPPVSRPLTELAPRARETAGAALTELAETQPIRAPLIRQRPTKSTAAEPVRQFGVAPTRRKVAPPVKRDPLATRAAAGESEAVPDRPIDSDPVDRSVEPAPVEAVRGPGRPVESETVRAPGRPVESEAVRAPGRPIEAGPVDDLVVEVTLPTPRPVPVVEPALAPDPFAGEDDLGRRGGRLTKMRRKERTEHVHEFVERRIPGGLVRRVCECGHVSIESSD